MPRVTADTTLAYAAAGTPHGFGGDLLPVLPPTEEDVYFRHTFSALPAALEDLGAGESISNTSIKSIRVVTPGFENANLSLITITNGSNTAIANGFFTGVFDQYFWRYHYDYQASANNAFYSDKVFPEANTARFPELPPVSDKPLVYYGKPDPRRVCTVEFTIEVKSTGGVAVGANGSNTLFVFTEDILNNWDVFRRRIVQLRTDGRLGEYNDGDTWNKVEYAGLNEELDSVDNVIEFGYTQINMHANTASISSITTLGTIQVVRT